MKILQGDALTRLREMPDASVQCAITSPPYWGLRDYGTGQWDGGDAGCDHRANGERRQLPHGDGRPADTDGYAQTRTLLAGVGATFKDICGKCGATRVDAQLGLEKTPDEYVAKMVAVFAEVRRVLRDDGSLWLNIGDSYNGYMANQRGTGLETERQQARKYIEPGAGLRDHGLKNKDLVGIPWLLAFALRADGWYLRQDIIWAKPNPMPESVTDRCTKSHEYLFLLTKSARYYYDAEAIKEPASGGNANGDSRKLAKQAVAATGGAISGGTERSTLGVSAKDFRNKRSVWNVAPQGFKGAHFAVYPPALIEPCILAGCPPGGVVLDPFTGSGTTGVVALHHQRDFLGIELNPDYIALAHKRILAEILS
jgi:DNA modification methylase